MSASVCRRHALRLLRLLPNYSASDKGDKGISSFAPALFLRVMITLQFTMLRHHPTNTKVPANGVSRHDQEAVSGYILPI